MIEYDGHYKVYESAESVQSAKSVFAGEFDVPYDECVASKVDWATSAVAVVHRG